MTVTAETLAQAIGRPQQTTSIGVSYGRGKVFSPDCVHLLDYRKWCDRLVELVDQQMSSEPTGLPNLSLLSPRTIDKFPEYPYLVVIEWTTLGQGASVRTTAGDFKLPFDELELDVTRPADHELEFSWSPADSPVWTGTVRTNGVIEARSEDLVVQDPLLGTVPLARFLTEHPPTVFYADGASTMGRVLFQPKTEYDDLGSQVVSAWAFEGVDIKAEASAPRPGMINIIDHITQELNTPDIEWVIVDDRAHEIADVIVIGKPDKRDRRSIALVHCKFSKEDTPGVRVEDLYEVLGQAGRSVVWLDLPRFARRLSYRLSAGSTVVAGDAESLIARLAEWSSSSATVQWSIAIAQPGLLASAINSSRNVKIMLTDILEWVAQHDTTFRVIAHR